MPFETHLCHVRDSDSKPSPRYVLIPIHTVSVSLSPQPVSASLSPAIQPEFSPILLSSLALFPPSSIFSAIQPSFLQPELSSLQPLSQPELSSLQPLFQ